jgi:2-phospho-L-lactate guanylyltransferase
VIREGGAAAGTWALVPVKRFDQGKSRLGEALSADARADLARSMFDRVVGSVLGGLAEAGDLGGTLVVTDGDDVADRAAIHGAQAMIAAGVGPGRKLGAIIDEGLRELTARGAEAAIVIMGDLPSLEADDVRALAALLGTHDVVIAPDAAGTGTNALAVHLPAPMPTRFCGGESLADHVRDAADRGLRVAMCERPGLGFDVDQPDDYARLSAGRGPPRA